MRLLAQDSREVLSTAGQKRLETLLDAASLAHFGTKRWASRALETKKKQAAETSAGLNRASQAFPTQGYPVSGTGEIIPIVGSTPWSQGAFCSPEAAATVAIAELQRLLTERDAKLESHGMEWHRSTTLNIIELQQKLLLVSEAQGGGSAELQARLLRQKSALEKADSDAEHRLVAASAPLPPPTLPSWDRGALGQGVLLPADGIAAPTATAAATTVNSGAVARARASFGPAGHRPQRLSRTDDLDQKRSAMNEASPSSVIETPPAVWAAPSVNPPTVSRRNDVPSKPTAQPDGKPPSRIWRPKGAPPRPPARPEGAPPKPKKRPSRARVARAKIALDSPQQTQRDWLFSQEEAWMRSEDPAKEQPLEQPPPRRALLEQPEQPSPRLGAAQLHLELRAAAAAAQPHDASSTPRPSASSTPRPSASSTPRPSFSSTPRPSATMRDTGAEGRPQQRVSMGRRLFRQLKAA